MIPLSANMPGSTKSMVWLLAELALFIYDQRSIRDVIRNYDLVREASLSPSIGSREDEPFESTNSFSPDWAEYGTLGKGRSGIDTIRQSV
ncbi:MAG: hypothetical protein WCJ40_07565 [Planctomycetota bacterium]